MKKFLDFTHDKTLISGYHDLKMVPLAPQERLNERLKKIFDKIAFGFKSALFPYVYFFPNHLDAQLFVYWHLVLQAAVASGKNQILFEALGSKPVLEFAKAIKNFSMISTLISPSKQGVVSCEFLESKLGAKSLCFSQRLKHPVLGTTSQDHVKIGQLLKDKGVLYHIDITSALGEVFFDLEGILADFITCDLKSFSSALHGGVVFSKIPIKACFNIPQQITVEFLEKFSEALENFYENASSEMLKKITLKMHLVNKLKEKIPEIQFPIEQAQESLSCKLMTLPKVHSDAINFLLQSQKMGIELGGGYELALHTALEMCFINPSDAISSLSLCLSEDLSLEDVDHFVSCLALSYQTLLKGAL